jgi:hypothetical protein
MKRKAPKSKGVLKPPLLVVSSEPVLQINVSSKLFHESSIEYQHHHDYDVIIPTYISWVALVVGHIMLVTGIVAMILGFYVVAPCISAVYFTTIVHWWCPRYSGSARTVDIFAVVTSLSAAVYESLMVARIYSIIFCSCVVLMIALFCLNEVSNYNE